MGSNPHHLFDRAKHEGWALGAFNVSNLETVKAICLAAQKLEAPVIIESSPGETGYIGAEILRSAVSFYKEQYQIQVFLNLDHAVEEEAIDQALAVGYDLIHFDGGKLEFEENLERTKRIAQKVHTLDRILEGEIDHITGSSTRHSEKTKAEQDAGHYTDPEQAAHFVAATGIDTLAVFIGNVHGVYADRKKLDLERLAAIRARVQCFMSLHGGSEVREADLKQALKLGIVKVNVNSELRECYLEAVQKAVKDPEELAPYKYMEPVVASLQKLVEKKITLFGSTGKAKRRWIKRTIA